jgi:elongation factor G
MGEMFNYAADLRSIARGRGSFRTEFSHYERVPYELQEKIVASSKKVEEEEE